VNLRTPICELFGVRYPIVQTGMGWVSTPSLVAATCNAGGLGILASATLSVAETDAAIAEVRSLTAEPFGVNMRGDAPEPGWWSCRRSARGGTRRRWPHSAWTR
jgi:NAD(P)H-dependent flavin oxidoreductase YrpB (nitropropane dioxygenase family)